MIVVLNLVWEWLKESKLHKTFASAAAGSSIGILTAMGVLEQKIDQVKQDVKYEFIETRKYMSEVENFVKARKELTDERFLNIDHSLKYLRGAIDVTNQNVLDLSNDIKRKR